MEKIGDCKTIDMDLLRRLKDHFGASMQAIAYRCRDLQMIDESTFRELFDEFERRGWRSPPYKEPGAMPAEEPSRFRGLIRHALDTYVITKSRAAELLNVKVDELFECLKGCELQKTIP